MVLVMVILGGEITLQSPIRNKHKGEKFTVDGGQGRGKHPVGCGRSKN